MMKKKLSFILLTLFLLTGLSACDVQEEATVQTDPIVDRQQLLDDIQYLSSDELKGRKTGEFGNILAYEFIVNRFQTVGLTHAGENGFRQIFNHTNSRTGEVFTDAVNLIGSVEGVHHSDRYIAVTAHYDHLGISDGEIYNGADDNASGTGALLAAAKYFSENSPNNSILFIAFDAEEQGLGGAHYFVQNPVVPLEQIVLNINMDMISNNFDDELYAVGTAHYPFLKPIIEEAVENAPINVLFGYDTDEWPQNWTMSSDHGPFHAAGVPFVYFGVEDHPHYHQPTDTFENINPDFYVSAVETIIQIIKKMDQQLDQVISASER